MRPAAKTTVVLAFFLALSLQAQTNTPDATPAVVREGVFRESQTILLGTTLRDANTAKKRNEILTAARLYRAGRVPLFNGGGHSQSGGGEEGNHRRAG